jgi:hypothetical protein
MNIEEIMTTDKTIDDDLRLKVTNHLLDMTNNTLVNSRLNKSQINAIAKLLTFSRLYKNDFTLKLAYDMLKLQVSLQGLGRKELVRILQTTSDLEQVDTKSSFKDVFR